MVHSASKNALSVATKSNSAANRPSSRTARVPTPMPVIDEIMPASEFRMTAVKEGQLPNVSTSVSAIGLEVAEQAHQFLEANIKAWMNPHITQVNHEADMPVPGVSGITQRALLEHNHSYQSQRRTTSCSSNPYSMITPTRLPVPSYRPQLCPHSQAQSHQASAAASFFARAAQKLNLSSRKKRHYHSNEESEADLPGFPTKFSDCLKISLPPAPPALLRNVGRKDVSGLGKVKVMLRLSPVTSCSESSSSFLTVDARKKQVTVFDPSSCGYVTPEERRAGVAAPKMFAFDAIFSQDDSQTEVCSSSLTEVIQAVVNGSDGCLFSYGPSKLGKTYTMLGSTESVQSLGIIPCAITWLYKLINEEKQKTGARFSVRVSAVEVAGRDEVLKDLLLEHANGTENSGTSPGIFLREDPIFGAQLQNQSELRVPSVEKAAYYLDAALAAATSSVDDDERNSHLLFTLHVYQYRVDKSGKGAVAGGRSRLHLLDLGSNERQGKGLSLSAIANVILAIFNGQKHVPYREFKLTQLLREVLGSISCRAAMIAHVTGSLPNYAETLATIQFAARIHRLRRKKLKYCGTSSGESSSEELKFRKHLREGGIRSGSSDPDCTSSSEQSGDTVIYVGHNGLPISDKELTDNEGPPRTIPVVFNKTNHDANIDQPSIITSGSCDLFSTNNTVVTGAHVKKSRAIAGDSKSGKALMSSGQTASRCSIPVKPSHLQKGHGKNSLIPVKMKSGLPVCNTGYADIELHSPLPHQYTLTSGSCQQRPSPPGVTQNARVGGVGSSEEQWVDGPRISKAWLESRSGLPRREMWIDGPQAIYGWMDQHKRDMIQRWVELQSAQVQGFSNESEELWVDDSLKSRLHSPPACSSTNLEIQNDASTEQCAQTTNCSSFRTTEKCAFSNGAVTNVCTNSKIEPTMSKLLNDNKLTNASVSQAEMPLQAVNQVDSSHSILQFVNAKSPSLNISGFSPVQQEEKICDGIPEMCSTEECIDNVGENNEMVECSPEHVPMVSTQDSCLQVNEEDIIAAFYGMYEEHPLRILSEENLASSFADSFSMSAELENLSVQESSDCENCDHMDEMALRLETMSHFSVPACFSHLSISQTVSKEICQDDASIKSEPIHLEPHQILTALRTNICWSGLGRWKETVTLSTCLQPESLLFPNETTKPNFSLNQQYFSKVKDDEQLSKTTCENRLRHPDGASNPDLNKTFEEPVCINTTLLPSFSEQRSPGNGASYSDNEDKLCDEWITDTDCANTIEEATENDKNQTAKMDEGKLDGVKIPNHRHSKLIRFFSSSKENAKAYDNHDKTSPKPSSRIPIANCKRKASVKLPLKNLYPQNCSVTPPPPDTAKSKKGKKLQLLNMPSDSLNLSVLAMEKAEHTNFIHNSTKTLDSGDTVLPLCIDKSIRSSSVGLNNTDNNSSLSSDTTPPSLKLIRKNGPPHQISGTSSGYESMIRDSEGSGSSFSNVDAATDSSDDEQARISNGAHPCENNKPCCGAFEVTEYNEEDIERLERRRLIEETLELRRHHRRVLHLRIKQDELRKDLAAAKNRLMANPQRWSYDLHVQDNMDIDDPGFLEVLERETQILEKRVVACKSRVVMVTAFDAKPKVLPQTEPESTVEFPL